MKRESFRKGNGCRIIKFNKDSKSIIDGKKWDNVMLIIQELLTSRQIKRVDSSYMISVLYSNPNYDYQLCQFPLNREQLIEVRDSINELLEGDD